MLPLEFRETVGVGCLQLLMHILEALVCDFDCFMFFDVPGERIGVLLSLGLQKIGVLSSLREKCRRSEGRHAHT